MHQKRQITTTKLPILRKGTKYIARAKSHLSNSVPTIIAIRDVLKLAKTSKEVKSMINKKLLKINGRAVKDLNESIKFFNVFDAGKSLRLTILPTGRFSFESNPHKDSRVCKVVDKRLIKKGLTQLNLHDGSNIVTKEDIKVNDSVILDFNGKLKSIIKAEKGKQVFAFSGKYQGLHGKIESLSNNKASVKFNNKENLVELPLSHLIVQ